MKNNFMLAFMVVLLMSVDILSAFGESMETNDNPVPEKLCALTFDDGPDIVKTARVLDKLEAHGVVASFFVVGQKINASTQVVLQRAVSLGCELHNHSWAYDSLDRRSAEAIKKSIDDTSAAIQSYGGVTPAFFRPPNLAVSALMYETIDLPFASGILGFDWSGGGSDTPDKVATQVLRGIRDGAIILLHDVQPDPHPTPDALDLLIPALKKQGYRFVTLTELFRLKGVDPASRKNDMWVYVP